MTGVDESLAIEKFNLYRNWENLKSNCRNWCLYKISCRVPFSCRTRRYLDAAKRAWESFWDISGDPENGSWESLCFFRFRTITTRWMSLKESNGCNSEGTQNWPVGGGAKIEILGRYVQKLIQDTVKLDETESLFKLLVDRYPMEEQVHGYYAVFYNSENAMLKLSRAWIDAEHQSEKWTNLGFQLIQIYLSEQNYPKLMDVTAQLSRVCQRWRNGILQRNYTVSAQGIWGRPKTNQQALEVISMRIKKWLWKQIFMRRWAIYITNWATKKRLLHPLSQALKKINP